MEDSNIIVDFSKSKNWYQTLHPVKKLIMDCSRQFLIVLVLADEGFNISTFYFIDLFNGKNGLVNRHFLLHQAEETFRLPKMVRQRPSLLDVAMLQFAPKIPKATTGGWVLTRVPSGGSRSDLGILPGRETSIASANVFFSSWGLALADLYPRTHLQHRATGRKAPTFVNPTTAKSEDQKALLTVEVWFRSCWLFLQAVKDTAKADPHFRLNPLLGKACWSSSKRKRAPEVKWESAPSRPASYRPIHSSPTCLRELVKVRSFWNLLPRKLT